MTKGVVLRPRVLAILVGVVVLLIAVIYVQTSRYGSMETALTQTKGELEEMVTTNSQLRNDLDEMTTTNGQLRSDLAEVKTAHAQAKDELDRKDAAHKLLLKDLAALKSEFERFKLTNSIVDTLPNNRLRGKYRGTCHLEVKEGRNTFSDNVKTPLMRRSSEGGPWELDRDAIAKELGFSIDDWEIAGWTPQ